MTIKENIAIVRAQIAAAAGRVGRDPSQIKLIAVSKKKPADAVYEAYCEGLTAFGENYVQELMQKQESDALAGVDGLEWHMIGHVQTNKVKYLIGRTALIQSLDSVRLAEEIQRQAKKASVIVDVLIEVNVAKEDNKYGFFIEDTQKAAEEISGFENIQIIGLMTSAPITTNPENNRAYFRQLNELYIDISRKKIHNTHMRVLSMGMSGDFEVAIEEGSNMLRLGTRLFGLRETG